MDNGIRNESHQIVEESKIQEMSSQDSPVNNSDAEVSKLDPDQISGIEKGEMFGGGAPAAEDSDLHNDFPDLTPTKSMDFPDGLTPFKFTHTDCEVGQEHGWRLLEDSFVFSALLVGDPKGPI